MEWCAVLLCGAKHNWGEHSIASALSLLLRWNVEWIQGSAKLAAPHPKTAWSVGNTKRHPPQTGMHRLQNEVLHSLHLNALRASDWWDSARPISLQGKIILRGGGRRRGRWGQAAKQIGGEHTSAFHQNELVAAESGPSFLDFDQRVFFWRCTTTALLPPDVQITFQAKAEIPNN